MNEYVRKSLPTKLAAIGFVGMILLGNYWVVLAIMKQPYPQWLMSSFSILAFWLLGCAVGIAFVTLRQPRLVTADDGSDDE